ncbi:MAG: hypothetical protein V1853_02815 [bacterium]
MDKQFSQTTNWSVALKHLFLASLFFALVVFIVDPFIDNFIQNFVDDTWLTIWVIITGILSIITSNQDNTEKIIASNWLRLIYFLITLLVGLWVGWSIRDLGWQAWLLGLLTAMVSWGILYGAIENSQSTND